MLGNHYILQEVARDLVRRLRGDAITELYTQEKDELVIAFRTAPGTLVLCCRRDQNCCFLHPAFTRSRRNSTDLLDSCAGSTIRDVTVHPSDRILSIHLDDGRDITAQFFGARANVLLIDNGIITGAFKNPSHLTGTPYSTPPPAEAVDLTSLELLTSSDRLPSSLLRSTLPQLGPILAAEVLARAGVSDRPGPHAGEVVQAIRQALVQMLVELQHPTPVIYPSDRHSPPLLSPVRLTHRTGMTAEPVEDLHAAIRSVLYTRRSHATLRHRTEQITGILERHIERTRRTIEALQHDLDTHHRAGEYERFGSLLLEHLSHITPGAAAVTLPAADEVVEIPLDPRLTASQNAQRYFDRAKRAKTARSEAAARKEVLAERLARASGLLADLSSLQDAGALTNFLKEHATAMEEFGIGEKGEPREAPLFRVFTVEGGFEVWAGKSSENNDLLTLRHARPNDLWFHARGASGSHVILRVGSAAGTPGKRAKEQAAGIAAYYSRMKTARLVPVAMTERKYVHKPRGAKAGTVTIDREQVIFAVPKLPSTE